MRSRMYLVLAAIAAVPATMSAQANSCAAGTTQDACQKAVDLFQYMAPQLGTVIAGGNATLGQGGTLGSWYKMSTLSAYRLRSDSPLINKGVSHPSTLSAVVTKDFYGGSAKLGGKHDIGVDEVR